MSAIHVTADEIRAALPDVDSQKTSWAQIDLSWVQIVVNVPRNCDYPFQPRRFMTFDKSTCRVKRSPKGGGRLALWERSFWTYDRGGPQERHYSPGKWRFLLWIPRPDAH